MNLLRIACAASSALISCHAWATPVVDGNSATAKRVDVITTASGRWTLDSLGAVGDIAAYRWRHEGNPHVRVMLCRAPATVAIRGGVPLVLDPVAVRIGAYATTAAVAPGACRVAENGPLAELNPAWLVKAVKDGRLPAYSRANSWRPAKIQPVTSLGAYDAAEIGRGVFGKAPSASGNFIGVTSSQGGEYESSRGFLHNIDARVVDLALHDERVGDVRAFERFTWESLAQPQGAVWSPVNHITADPQFPLPGDRAYSVNLSNQVPPAGAENMVLIKDWGRDLAHLENTCYVHWIMSGDPVAAICLNRQLAFALANQGFAYRSGTYSGLGGQERGVYNTITALWKSRDVALHMTSLNGKVLWGSPRIEKMRADVFANFDRRARGLPTPANPSPSPADTAARAAVGVVAHFSLWPEPFARVHRTLAGTSNFELVQYGKEPLYLWSKAGDPTMRRWMIDSARELSARALLVGGARGVDQCKGATGSGFPVSEMQSDRPSAGAAKPTWSDAKGWAKWINTAICPDVTNTTFTGANNHTTIQLYNALRMFREAGAPGLDPAIAHFEAVRAATDLNAMHATGLNWPKHWAGPLTGDR